jgi:hypothetical protein
VKDCGAGNISVNRICRTGLICPNEMVRTPTSECVASCISTEDYKFTSEDKKSCLAASANCPNYYTENTLMCVASCPNTEASDPKFKDGSVCKTACPALTHGFECVTSCPVSTLKTPENICLANCATSNLYPYADTATTCAAKCPVGTYYSASDSTNTCGSCTDYILDGEKCVTTCPVVKGSDKNCANQCKPNEFLQNGVCVASCTSNLHNEDLEKNCVSTCTGLYPLQVSGPNRCVDQCPLNLQRELKTCVASCTGSN